jgi:hypothetical protein
MSDDWEQEDNQPQIEEDEAPEEKEHYDPFGALADDFADVVTLGIFKSRDKEDEKEDTYDPRYDYRNDEPSYSSSDTSSSYDNSTSSNASAHTSSTSTAHRSAFATPVRKSNPAGRSCFIVLVSLVIVFGSMQVLGIVELRPLIRQIIQDVSRLVNNSFPRPQVPGLPLVATQARGGANPSTQATASLKQQEVVTQPPATTLGSCLVVNTGGQHLRVRASADLSSDVLGTLLPGQRVEVLEWGSQWHKIRNKEITGYVSATYCKRDE